MKARAPIPEGGVFAIPCGDGQCVFAQLWTIGRDGVIGHCGIARIIGEQGAPLASLDWSDARIYERDINLIIDVEWLRTGWSVVAGFRPAKTPLRDELPFWLKVVYDAFGWRPQINTFYDFDSAVGIAREVRAQIVNTREGKAREQDSEC